MWPDLPQARPKEKDPEQEMGGGLTARHAQAVARVRPRAAMGEMDEQHVEQSWVSRAQTPTPARQPSNRLIVLGVLGVALPLYAAYGLGLFLAVKGIIRAVQLVS